MSKNPGTVDIHGREYKTVALRVDEFRADHPDWTIDPTIVEADERIVVMRCEILDENGRLRAAGQAEENRTDGKINRTSAMENCETSAVGRALAFLGYAGSEIASADEVASAINSKPINRAPQSQQTPVDGPDYSNAVWAEPVPRSRTDCINKAAEFVRQIKDDVRRQEWMDAVMCETTNKGIMHRAAQARVYLNYYQSEQEITF